MAFSVVRSGLAAADVNYDAMWDQFKLQYGKRYTVEEDGFRFNIFKGKVDYIENQNAQHMSYTLGLNEYSDFTVEEVAARYMGARFSGNPYGDVAYLGRHSWQGEALPEAVDWTQKGAVTGVKDQAMCGSCWAFSAVGALEGAHAVASGNLVSLSEQQAMQCSREGTDEYGRGCDGGWPDEVFKYAQDHDLCTEESYPYQKVETIPCFWNVNPPKCSEVGVPKGSVTGFKDVTPHSEQDLMSAVAQQPVSVALDSSHFLDYKGGVYDGPCGTGMDHAVLVVGYTADAWKIKNSWGTSFGESGYIRLKKGAGGAGTCGLLGKPSFPVLAAVESVV